MVAAIEEITVREGINPRDSFFVCGGGATAIHIADMADILGLKRYMIPRFMAGLSAFGGLISDIRKEDTAVLLTSSAAFDAEKVSASLAGLIRAGNSFLVNAQVLPENRRFEFSFLGRYEYQSFEIEVPFTSADGMVSAEQLATFVEDFHRMHERIYSIRADGDIVEFTGWKLRSIGKRTGQDVWLKHTLPEQTRAVTAKAMRMVYSHDRGRFEAIPVYDLTALGAGARVAGPCIIDAPTFTAFLKPGHNGAIDMYGNVVVAVD
jgi:N-methylhydantoinase A